MFRHILTALKSRKPKQGLQLSLVLDPAKASQTSCVRHRLIVGGKVIDLIHESGISSKGTEL